MLPRTGVHWGAFISQIPLCTPTAMESFQAAGIPLLPAVAKNSSIRRPTISLRGSPNASAAASFNSTNRLSRSTTQIISIAALAAFSRTLSEKTPPWDQGLTDGCLIQDFSRAVESESICAELSRAIHGAGAFRNFKDTVRRLGIESGWFAFRTMP